MAQRYSVVCKLVSKSANNLTPTESGLIAGGDLTPYLNRLEYTNCGIDRQNNAVVSLDVPTDGTFIRTAPILVDKEAKHNYLIDIQITSDGNAGKLFRGMLGQVSSKISATGGQTIDIPLQGIEICMQESYEGFRSRTETPKGRFIDVVTRHKDNGGSDGTIITFTNDNQIDLPDSKAIKQDWKPFGLKTFSDLLGDVIRKLEENPTTGGTLTDYYFDYSPDSSYTRLLLINAEKFGENSTGVTLDPLLISPTGQDDEETLETIILCTKIMS